VAAASAQARAATAKQIEEYRRSSAGLWSDAWYRLRRDKVTMAALFVLIVLIVLSAAAPLFAEYVFKFRFEQQDLLSTYAKPEFERPEYLFGGDEIGRSQVVRLLYGGQVSLLVGFLAMVVQLTIGVSVGLIAGYLRGGVDDTITFGVTVLNSIPALFLLLIISALFSPSPLTLILILGIIGWTGIANFVRGQTFALREREFVTAAKTIGATPLRIMIKHVLPNILPLIFVLAAIDVGQIILVESALSYLGLGIQPPTPSWGNMLTNAVQYFSRAWWLVVSPGAMIFLTVLCTYLIGDGLRDALDPRLRGST
jgi:peptide/nickel transport system permease protein